MDNELKRVCKCVQVYKVEWMKLKFMFTVYSEHLLMHGVV